MQNISRIIRAGIFAGVCVVAHRCIRNAREYKRMREDGVFVLSRHINSAVRYSKTVYVPKNNNCFESSACRELFERLNECMPGHLEMEKKALAYAMNGERGVVKGDLETLKCTEQSASKIVFDAYSDMGLIDMAVMRSPEGSDAMFTLWWR